ncbi:rhodanese-like domain-containing protein [Aureimonas psammosilenae]|uniref:rhodanese-like domain-containing protein n=1 Tax=Aureimonas psammosilenae TaxID=2495496 RepID=UPI0012604246|nr:rhodanese-like domain-containing protein [Aureimonas psammosilenae]
MSGNYEDDVTVTDCWSALSSDPDAFLIDVRTSAEWNFVGVPTTPGDSHPVLLAEWQSYPSMAVDPSFVEDVTQHILRSGGTKESRLFFLCRSGARSMASAGALTGAGFLHCFNVLGGFEGPVDPDGHRGTVAGWKAEGLPWSQR